MYLFFKKTTGKTPTWGHESAHAHDQINKNN